MTDLNLNASFAALGTSGTAQLQEECAAMSENFAQYQVSFQTEEYSLSQIGRAMQNVAALGMQSDIDEGRVQKFLFDTTTGFLVTGYIQQPLYIAVVDDVPYLVSGRHRATGLSHLVDFGLSLNTKVACVVFYPASISIAMSMVMTSNGSRAVSKGESQGFKLARFGVSPDTNDCLRAGRDGTLSQSDAYINAAWFSYNSQEIGTRSITTVQSIAKSFYTLVKKLNYSFLDTCTLLDDMLFCIEEAAALAGETNLARKQGTVAENIVEILAIEAKKSPAKRQATRNVKAALFTRKL